MMQVQKAAQKVVLDEPRIDVLDETKDRDGVEPDAIHRAIHQPRGQEHEHDRGFGPTAERPSNGAVDQSLHRILISRKCSMVVASTRNRT